MDLQLLLRRLNELGNRVQGYPWYEVALELVLIWVLVYLAFRFLRGTRGARAIKGAAVVLVLATIVIKIFSEQQFERLTFLYRNMISVGLLALVVVFQPELRRALVKLGEINPLGERAVRRALAIEELLDAVAYLSKNKIGALIAIERQIGLRGIIESGTRLDSAVSSELLKTIFWPGSALHDMGVVIQGDRIIAASVQFPLAEGEQFSSELGSRHRSAIGLSQESDALVVVVSEETGIISLAEHGQLTRNLTIDGLRTYLVRGLGKTRHEQDTEDIAPEATEST